MIGTYFHDPITAPHMTEQTLANASEHLESAASQTTAAETSERLTELAEQVADLAANESRADHGRIARIQAAIDEIQPKVDDETATTIEAARDDLGDFRETLDGV
jgi:anti-sigma28 factor (negative regulator of flagellin synthesis)